MKSVNLLSIDSNAKTVKGQLLGYFTALMYLAPWKIANGAKNVCADASKGCIDACLYTAGMGSFSNVQLARINKTLLFFDQKLVFMGILEKQLIKFWGKYGSSLAIRLNGTSDIPFENVRTFDGLNIFERFVGIQFYDYTKSFKRVIDNKQVNYHLTFSVDERDTSKVNASKVLQAGKNIALVVSTKLYKELFGGTDKEKDFKEVYIKNLQGAKFELLNGDINDLRFKDRFGIVVLKAKGKANKDRTGFVFHDIIDIINLTEL
jgi:hypothetical protein